MQKSLSLLPKLSNEQIVNLVINSLIPNAENVLKTIQKFILRMDIDQIRSIGTREDTFPQFADFIKNQHWYGCYDLYKLYPNKIKCVSHKIPCFWSCKSGRNMAFSQSMMYTDTDCPIISLLFAYCVTLTDIAKKLNRKDYFSIIKELSFGISRIYASFAYVADKNNINNNIHIFMGTDKLTEEIGFHIGNNFWSAEFPILRGLLDNHKIDDIILNIIKNDTIIKQISIKNDEINLPLWRRSWHPIDGENAKNSFIWPPMDNDDWERWRVAPPRQFITFQQMLNFIKIWREKSLTKS